MRPPGGRLNIKMSSYQYRDPMLKIRRSCDLLIRTFSNWVDICLVVRPKLNDFSRSKLYRGKVTRCKECVTLDLFFFFSPDLNFWECIEGMASRFVMMTYPDHLQNSVDFSHALIFYIFCAAFIHWKACRFLVPDVLFTQGQFWPSGIVVACLCLCVCPCVCLNP